MESTSRLQTYDEQRSFQVIRLAITEEIAYDQDGQNEQSDHEDLKVEVHGFVEDPANDDDKGRVEESGLDGRAEAVVEGEVLRAAGKYN